VNDDILRRIDRHMERGNELMERMERLTEIVIDHRDEGRVQTRALLRVLDRLEGSGPAAAT
jgi:hypothetical protein